VRCYPPDWRARYGDELAALILDMSGDRRVPWRICADVATAGARERRRAAGLADGGTPEARVRGGVLLVLWASALFALAGMIVQKTSEHWQDAMPAGAHTSATLAFGVLLMGAAIGASGLMLAGIASAAPSALRFVREDGWSPVRRHVLRAAVMTLIMVAATAGLVVWADGLSAHARAGHDSAYAVAFVAWALLGAGTVLTWTAAAAKTASCLRLTPSTLRTHARLASAVSLAMGVMTAATVTWWASVAYVAPAALTGGSPGGHPPALVPQLIVAAAMMLLATGLGAAGARRATHALPAVTNHSSA
jgi:hypothetical protein